jgi:subtilisin family serine protease
MLAGAPVAGMSLPDAASSGWFGNFAAANQPSHAAAPSISASSVSVAPVPPLAGRASAQIDWIVQFNAASVEGITNASGAAGLLRPASGNPGGVQFQIIEGLGAVGEVLVRSSGATAGQAAAALQSDKSVAWFEADSLAQVNAALPNDPNYPLQWSLSNTGQDGGTPGDDIDAAQAWKITTGSKSVVVAEIDSGVDYTDPDLAANIWTNPNAGQDGFSGDVHGYNFVSNSGDPMDDNGHGTFVAGEIGAAGDNGQGVTGVNWNVTIMPLKFLDANGNGYTSDAIRAINYAVMERTEFGVNVRVINASWTGTISDPGLTAAIAAAGNAGILFVAAAGNSASNNDATPEYPANTGLPNVISVAASDHNDQLTDFSDYGASTVNLAAPGVDIYSTLPGGKFGYLSGTSMAAPEVAGVAALAWAADPSASVADVRNAILQGTVKIPGLAGKVSSGGVLNAYNTLKLLIEPTPAPAPTPSPVPIPSPTPTPVPGPAQGTNPATAVPVAIGSTVAGNLASANQMEYFKVQVVTGQTYTFRTSLGTLYDSVLTLLGTNAQTVIAQNDDMAPGNRASSITWQATGSGDYYLAVGSYPGAPLGSFTLSTGLQAPPPNPSPVPIPSPAPSPNPPALSLAPIGNQTMAAGASLTLALAGSDPRGGRISFSASAANSNAVSAMVFGNQLTIRAAAGYAGSVEIAVTASSGAASAVQSFAVNITRPQSSAGQPGGSVAIPSATLPSAAAAVFSSTSLGAVTRFASNSFRAINPAALDTLFAALGR